MGSPVIITPAADPYDKYRVPEDDPYAKYIVKGQQGNTPGPGTGSRFMDALIGDPHIGNIASGLWDFVKSATPHLMSSGDASKGIQADRDMLGEIGDHIRNAITSTDPLERHRQGALAINKVVTSIVPGIGDAENEYETGDKEGAAGTALHALAKIYLGKKIGELATRGTAAAYRNLAKPDVPSAVVDAWNPPAQHSDFPAKAEQAISDVKTYGGGPSAKPGLTPNPNKWGNFDFAPSELNPRSGTDNAINILQGGMDQWVDRAEKTGVTLSGDNIVRAVDNAIPDRVRDEDPTYVAGLMDRVKQAYGGKRFTPSKFRDFLKTGNASDSPFYSKLQTSQGTSSTAGTPPAIDAALTNAIRGELYPAMDPENGGAGPREIQDRTGSLIAVRNQSEQNHIGNLKQKPNSYLDVAPKIIKGAVNTATGGMIDKLAATSSLAHPLIGPQDALIDRLMQYAPEADAIPLPKGPYPTTGWGNQITSGDIITPAPVEPNIGPRGAGHNGPVTTSAPVPGFRVGFPADVPKQLPASRAMTSGSEGTGGVIVSDIIGRSSKGSGSPVPLLESRDPNNPAPSILPTESREILSPSNREWMKSDADVIKGQSVIITPRGARVINNSGLERESGGSTPPVNATTGFNPETTAKMLYKKSYDRLTTTERTNVDNVVSGKSKIKISDFMK